MQTLNIYAFKSWDPKFLHILFPTFRIGIEMFVKFDSELSIFKLDVHIMHEYLVRSYQIFMST